MLFILRQDKKSLEILAYVCCQRTEILHLELYVYLVGPLFSMEYKLFF